MLNTGDEVEAKFIGVDRKNRTISLSIKAKDTEEEAEAVQEEIAGRTVVVDVELPDEIGEELEFSMDEGEGSDLFSDERNSFRGTGTGVGYHVELHVGRRHRYIRTCTYGDANIRLG